MQLFTLSLTNGATLTGRQNIPIPSESAAKYQPLVVALHGGTYTSSYFDSTTKYSLSGISNNLSVPFVAIDRPGYGGSTPTGPIPEDSIFHEEWGIWLHRYILPALWVQFGVPNHCTAIVLLCHSMGATGGTVAAALHETEKSTVESSSYPLAGLIISGFGVMLQPQPAALGKSLDPSLTHIVMPSDIKNLIMLGKGNAEPEIYESTEITNAPMPIEEEKHMRAVWLGRWQQKWARHIKVPVMIGIAEKDGLWQGTEEHLKAYMAAFTASKRVDGSLVLGAPHNMELSYWGPGWTARGFGFALECAAAFMIANEQAAGVD